MSGCGERWRGQDGRSWHSKGRWRGQVGGLRQADETGDDDGDLLVHLDALFVWLLGHERIN